MQLTHAQKQHFVEQGFVQVPGVVPPAMVARALKAINHCVGEGMDPEQMPFFRARSFCPEVQDQPPIVDLFYKTPALSLAESAIGEGQIEPVPHGQIALRFPTLDDPPGEPHPHIDGMHTPTNGVPEGEIYSFTMLLGVMLSDVTSEYAGNLTVWPGTHYKHEAYFRERGAQSLLEGMPKVEMPEPHQVLARAGDVVLAHYETAHGITPNASPHPRYAIYFRLKRKGHNDDKWNILTDIWREWDGLREIVDSG